MKFFLDKYPARVYTVPTQGKYPQEVLPWNSAATAAKPESGATRSSSACATASAALRARSGAYCTDIHVQVSAVNAALNSFSKELLSEHLRTCVADNIRQGNDGVIDELVGVLQKLMK